jgi:hypothetical protein
MPWSTDLLEKLTVPQLVKKFPTFMEPEGSLLHSEWATARFYPDSENPVYFPSTLNSATNFLTNGPTLEMRRIPQVKQAGKLLNFYVLIITVFVTIMFGNPAF